MIRIAFVYEDTDNFEGALTPRVEAAFKEYFAKSTGGNPARFTAENGAKIGWVNNVQHPIPKN